MKAESLRQNLGIFADGRLFEETRTTTHRFNPCGGTVRRLNRLEIVGETLRQALDSLAVVVPEWTRTQSQQEWLEPYGSRVENDRLPKSQTQCDEAAYRLGRTDWCGWTGALESHFQ